MEHDMALAIGLVCAMSFMVSFSVKDKLGVDWVCFAVITEVGAVAVFFLSYMVSYLIAVGL